MSEYTDIYYTDYFDFPRLFVVVYDRWTFLFDAGYDALTDEYAEKFHVFLLPKMTLDDARDQWTVLGQRVSKDLDYVSVQRLHFAGESHHRKLDVAILKELVLTKVEDPA